MALKDFDYKQFLMERGERVGLYAAGGIAGLFIFCSLIWPGKALFNASPRAHSELISKTAADKKKDVQTLTPSEAEKEKLSHVDPQLQKQAATVAEDPTRYRLTAELFAPRDIQSSKRHNPDVYGPEEFQWVVVPGQLSSYIIETQAGKEMIGILRTSRKGAKPGSKLQDPFSKFGGAFGRGGGAGGGAGFPGAPPGFNTGKREGFGGPGMPGGGTGGVFDSGGKKENLEVQFVAKDELEKLSDSSFARDLYPLPMAIVAGSFPLAAQVAEFQKALRVDQPGRVVQETVTEKDKKGIMVTKPAFRFVGFKVLRKTYGPDGQMLDDWRPLDFESKDSPYINLMRLVGHEPAKEDPKLEPLLLRGLYLDRPVQITLKQDDKPKSYPDIEEQLPKIRDTLAALTPKQTKPPTATSKFDEGYSPFGAEAPPAEGATEPDPAANQEWTPANYCVVRFLDLGIQPNQSYEYRIKIRMANPNYNKPDSEVAFPALAVQRELESDWYDVKGTDGKVLRVSIPTDIHYYTLDERAYQQSLLAPKQKNPYRGMNRAINVPDPARQTVVQIHRWMGQYELTRGNKVDFYPVGDWIIGERMFVFRGELLGQKAPTHVPIWAPEESGFILAGKPVLRGQDRRQIDNLTLVKPDKAPLLVDFEGGGKQIYRHGGAPVAKNEDGTPVEGPKPGAGVDVTMVGTTTEVLLLTPDGKLLAHDSATDEEDETRKDREKLYTQRVEEAATGKAAEAKPAEKPK